MKKVSLAQSKLENLNYFLVSSLFMITIGIILIFSSIFVIRGYITIGALTAVLMYNHMLVDPIINVLDIQQDIRKLTVSLKRIGTLFELTNDRNISKEVTKIDCVSLKDISFSYNGVDTVLDNVNLEISMPHNVCIMGKSESGKTTLANLIAGLYEPSSGEISYYYRGAEVDGMPNISYLIQDGYLFDVSIIQNIKIAHPNITDSEIDKIIQMCCLDDMLKLHGDSPIGENGGHLSGGEKKRVRIAQALASTNADIYIFDELTSSLDELTASMIFDNILKLNLGKICIFIEHNDKILPFMENVVVVEGGKVHGRKESE